MNLETRVLLLGCYKKDINDTFLDIVKSMVNNRVFSLEQGKEYLRILRDKKYLLNNTISMIGIAKAKEIEVEFKIN